VCGSGTGMAISANKTPGIRAANCWAVEIAKLARQHNNANVLCLPSRFITEAEAHAVFEAFLATAFEGGRHENRVNKIEKTC
jgi:ribose 5-phosphate isomerase B